MNKSQQAKAVEVNNLMPLCHKYHNITTSQRHSQNTHDLNYCFQLPLLTFTRYYPIIKAKILNCKCTFV